MVKKNCCKYNHKTGPKINAMETITTVEELKDAIQRKEFDREMKGEVLREQILYTIDYLKPANLIMTTMRDITTSPYLLENILAAAAGLVSGFISKRIATGRSGNLIRNVLGTILQFGVTNRVARYFLKR